MMKTEVYKIDGRQPDEREVNQAAKLLLDGRLVAIPTETVYGLGANALDPAAVKRIFEVKGRPQDNPLIIHVASPGDIKKYCEQVPQAALTLAARFWPGPLTMVLKRKEIIPDEVTAGLDTVAIRCPDSGAALAVIKAAGVPIAAPSANISGKPSPTTARHVLDDLDGKIEGVVDGGPCRVGLESTIIDLTATPPRLLRPGGISKARLETVLGAVETDAAVTRPLGDSAVARAPGMKYRHYAPSARVVVVTGPSDKAAGYINSKLSENDAVLCFDEELGLYPGSKAVPYGGGGDHAALARNLFSALRSLDKPGIETIYARCPEGEGIAGAVRNRLSKAAGFNIVEV